MRDIFYLHSGKAAYPEVEAYKYFFNKSFNVFDGNLDEYSLISDKKNTILWCLMGFYPKKIDAGFIIHDYRSLSVGSFSKIKDNMKKTFNIKPNVRIFLNEKIKSIMGFKDNIPSIILDMGVPEWIFDLKEIDEYKSKYCYIGEISRERKMDKLLDSYVRNKKNNDTLLMVGTVESKIMNRYRDEEGIKFLGKVPQKQALIAAKSCDVAICYIPTNYPYCYQTPTKLLEYAALGVDIIMNHTFCNVAIAEKISNKVKITGNDFFDENEWSVLQQINEDIVNIHNFEWSNVIRKSTISNYL